MYMIELTEDKLSSMVEHVELGLKHMSKLMQCLEELEEETSSGAYGEKGRLGMQDSDSNWEDDERKYRSRYSRIRRY